MAAKKQRVIAKLGRAALDLTSFDLEGVWLTEDGDMIVSRESSGTFLGRCETTEKETLGLFGFSSGRRQVVVEVKLRAFGNAFEGTLSRGRHGGPTLLGGLLGDRTVTGFFEENGQTVRLQHWDYGWQETTWTRRPKQLTIPNSSQIAAP